MSLLTMPYLDTFPTISSSTSGGKIWSKEAEHCRVTAYQTLPPSSLYLHLLAVSLLTSHTLPPSLLYLHLLVVRKKKQNIDVSLLTIPPSPLYLHLHTSYFTSGGKIGPKKQNIVKLRIENPPWVGLECLVGLDRILGLVGSECFLDRNAFTRKGTQVLQGRLSP